MATSKSFTDISQSKKLAKMLPLESADMLYLKREINDTYIETSIVKPIGKVPNSLPCWSVGALLKVLHENKICHYDNRYYCQYMTEGSEFPIYSTAEYDNPIDACVEMIIKLRENELI